MAYLLDTSVISELRKAKPDPGVLSWYRQHGDEAAYVSILAVGEIRQGIERLRRRDGPPAEILDRWLAGLIALYRDRILPITLDVAQEWGRLSGSPEPPPIIDGLMAATAKIHQLTFVTRNVSDVSRTGAQVFNPFTSA